MKCAIVLADGIKQVMFTAENESEKKALYVLNDVDSDITIEHKRGSFYDGFRDQKSMGCGYNVALCQNGYLRAYEDSDSLMLVLRNKKLDAGVAG